MDSFDAVAQRMLKLGRERGQSDDDDSDEEEAPASRKKQLAKVIQLPIWREPDRSAPSAIFRSALFGITQRGPRTHIDDEFLASWSGSAIRYKGDQLDQFDEDVWLQALHLHRMRNLADDEGIRFSARQFLRSIGRDGDGRSIRRLYKSLLRMTACVVVIETQGARYFGSLIDKGAEIKDPNNGHYYIKLNADLKKLFDTGFTKLDWETRRSLRTDLARWLHAYVQTHKATDKHPHRIGVDKLRDLCGSDDKALKSFRQRLRRSMEQLEKAEVVTGWRITPNDALEFVRPRKQATALLPAT